MPYKDYEKTKKRSLEYYYNNKDKVLDYQKKRLADKYKNNLEFKNKRQIRDKTRMCLPKEREKLEGRCVCNYCGNKKDLQRHHTDNYNYKKIKILCRKCHNELHESLNREKVAIN
jgi:hypothetical protein